MTKELDDLHERKKGEGARVRQIERNIARREETGTEEMEYQKYYMFIYQKPLRSFALCTYMYSTHYIVNVKIRITFFMLKCKFSLHTCKI